MPVNIHGKEYMTVAERINDFRAQYKEWTIDTDLISNADLIVVKCTIHNDKGHQVGSGYAEEVRGSTNINKTSALENCETSAIGRALASCGFGGTQYSSANEVGDAIINQAKMEVAEFFINYNKLVERHLPSIFTIKDHILHNLSTAAEAWYELSEEDQRALWVAPSKGGIFTTKEREIIKSSEFRKSHFGESND